MEHLYLYVCLKKCFWNTSTDNARIQDEPQLFLQDFVSSNSWSLTGQKIAEMCDISEHMHRYGSKDIFELKSSNDFFR